MSHLNSNPDTTTTGIAIETAATGIRQNKGDLIFRWLTTLCAFIILITILGIFLVLVANSTQSIDKFGLNFLVSDSWNPVKEDFGAASSIFGTLVSTLIAMVIAAPISIVIALLLVELVHPIVSRIVGTAIELLAAIPSIIFGMWGLFVFAPFMRNHIQPLLGDWLGFLPLFEGPPIGIGMLTAGIILALMILPFIAAFSRDVLNMVPAVIKESGYGIGSTTWEVTKNISLRYGMRGMIGAMFLGLGRAIGETMAVTFVIGNAHYLSASLFAPGNTIASTLANEFGEAVSEPLFRSVLIELGLILFLVTMFFQLLAHFWLKRLHKTMEEGA